MGRLRRTAGLAVLLVCLSVLATGATAAHAWAPAATATIHPGVQLSTDAGQCTANFVFTEGSTVYIGSAAHCTSSGGLTDTDGCESDSFPIGTPVTVDGASRPGILAYSSWATMRAVGETDPDACAYNDFALVRIDPADVAKVNPTVPHWGGPTGISSGTTFGQQVYSYGNSSLRQGLTLLSPKTGVSLGQDGDGWNHTVYTLSPGIPGDSGSAYLDSTGRALGLLSTVHFAPLVLANGVTDLRRALEYLTAHTPLRPQLAQSATFTANRLPLGL